MHVTQLNIGILIQMYRELLRSWKYILKMFWTISIENPTI